MTQSLVKSRVEMFEQMSGTAEETRKKMSIAAEKKMPLVASAEVEKEKVDLKLDHKCDACENGLATYNCVRKALGKREAALLYKAHRLFRFGQQNVFSDEELIEIKKASYKSANAHAWIYKLPEFGGLKF
jgi:hypothetical protein